MSKGDKYLELEHYLEGCKKNTICLSFDQIQKIIGFVLPDSALKYNAWWSNDMSHSQAVSWLNAGYRTKLCDFKNKTVTFTAV